MSKYDPLKDYLLDMRTAGQEEVSLSFDKLEAILGFALHQSAYHYPQWWENDKAKHPQARAWLDAGWECVRKDMASRRVTFRVQTVAKKPKDREQHNYHVIASEHIKEETHTEPGRKVSSVLVFSPCSSSKCDEPEELPPDFNPVTPVRWLETPDLIDKLIRTREQVLNDPRAQKGAKETLAFDLYVKAKRSIAYKRIRESNYRDLRKKLLSSDELQWFFLSGGYGVVHALERAKKYSASVSGQSKVFYTAGIWRKTGLSLILDAIVKKLSPSRMYVFGTPRYLEFIEKANFYEERMEQDRIKVFEGFGDKSRNAGLQWLSERLKEFAEAIIHDDLGGFDRKHPERYNSNKN